jgi:monoamine oxidase
VTRIDVAIVGAGAAGLAAADALHRANHSVAVFEARDRLGGRIFTARDPRVPLPIELGAEFVHGDAPETYRVIRDASLLAYDVTGAQWIAEHGRVRPADYSGRIDRVLERIDTRRPDQSFEDFLAGRPGGRTLAPDRATAREFVQGYHAADPDLISAHSIAPHDTPPSAAALHAARVVPGYDRVPHWLARSLGGRIRLNAAVREIRHEHDRATLTIRSRSGRTHQVHSRAVIVTVPIGVLRARPGQPGAIRLIPDPPRLRSAVNLLTMGSVMRASFWFSDYPWQGAAALRGRPELDRMGFLHTRGSRFNVWWTPCPARWPLLVAWSGGPPAASLARMKRSEIERVALHDLAERLGVSYRWIVSRVRGTWLHRWDRDPFARGAYSYALVGGSDAARELARPVGNSLFLAGEATAPSSGTVESAIGSGLRAARQVRAALAR